MHFSMVDSIPATDEVEWTSKFRFAELKTLQQIQGELPQVVVIHKDLLLEDKVKEEIAKIAIYLKTSITITIEGMIYTL